MAEPDHAELQDLELALASVQPWDAQRVRLTIRKAQVLTVMGRVREADALLSRARDDALEHGGGTLFDAAQAWATRCAELRDWSEAAVAAEQAVCANADLMRRQVHLDYKRLTQRNASAMAALAADAYRRMGRLDAAVAALERGQSMILVEDYLTRPAIASVLRERDPELAAEYGRQLEIARDLNAPDARLRAAHTRLDELLARAGLDRADMATARPVSAPQRGAAVYLCTGFALIVDGTRGVRDLDLPGLTSEDLREVAVRFTKDVVAGDPSADVDRTVEDTCRWIDDIIMTPLGSALGDLDQITLIPTGLLAGLPIHAAGNAIHERVHTYLPAAAIGRPEVQSLPDTLRLLAVIDPPHAGHPRLRGTRREAQAAAKAYPRTIALIDAAATADRVAAALPDADIVHFGCHGVSKRDPLDSALLLAGSDSLTLRSLLADPDSMRHTRLVVLGACQTSVADWDLPSESFNLTTGMLVAGAQAVIGTLWPVGDQETATLMEGFYTRLADGLSPKQALAQAQQSLADEPRYDWAGFVYVGL
ncbi:MAG: CHAT domain-containing protein [Candidatus Phosphoribacter sp.]|nr:CHAT domain-containing protein [Actinomycetales bacterium]